MVYSLGDDRVEFRGVGHFVAPDATLVGNVVLEHQVSVWFQAVIRGDNDRIHIGAGSNIQDGSVLHTDAGIPLTVGNAVTVGHQVMLHGCTIGEGSLIGIKAVVLNGAVVGRECLIGACSLIPEGKVIPDRSLVMGTPGKVVRTLTDVEVAELRAIAEGYVVNARRYRALLRADTAPVVESATGSRRI
ncbi:MAG: gamma carbonic anhydrase family protein [Betaproteobacteria bacterium]